MRSGDDDETRGREEPDHGEQIDPPCRGVADRALRAEHRDRSGYDSSDTGGDMRDDDNLKEHSTSSVQHAPTRGRPTLQGQANFFT
ncbi:hypothetical protein GALLR39Z86_50200 [Glycomyces algeriensis]|uniref:Uncharacterized protein n=1 Tax=Glycomyces algeriensis TaxID=256037 RepID=A0A9W6GBT3_9ACTN|nr:hypothetical protein GALLR39Z86_50200 [Glycomyces algeriensis]